MGNIKTRMVINSQLMTDPHSMIGITDIWRCNFNSRKRQTLLAIAAADRITVINGSHSLIKHMTIRSAGKIIYDTDNLHKVCFVKNLLEYSDDFSRSVAKNSFWYLDTEQQPQLEMPDLKLGGCNLKRFKTMEAAVQRTSM